MTVQYGTLTSSKNAPTPSPQTWRYNVAIMSHGSSLIVLLASIAVNYWVTGTAMGHTLNIGLWRACLDGQCVSLFDFDSELLKTLGHGMIWVQIFSVMSLLLSVLSFICAVIIMIFAGSRSISRHLTGLSILTLVSGGLTSMSTLIFYTSVYRRLLTTGNTDDIMPGTVGWLVASSILNLLATVFYALEYSVMTATYTRLYEYVPLTTGTRAKCDTFME